MRTRTSDAVLRLQPLFLLAPVLVLVCLNFTAGWRPVALAVLAMAGFEGFLALRSLSRARAAEHPAESGDAGPGLPLLRADGHARLWALVDESAAAAQVAPPARIVLSLGTTAAIRPLTSVAVPTVDPPQETPPIPEYELVLSPALLAECQVPHLAAVLAHELGHVAGGALKRSDSIERFVRDRAQPLYDALPSWGWLRVGGWIHLQLWLLVDAWAERPTELAADEIAFGLAGPRTTAAALTTTDRLGAAQQAVEDRYLPLADRAYLRPSVLEAMHELLTAPAGGVVDEYLALEPGRLDWLRAGHPTTAQRIAAAERAARNGRGVDADARSASSARESAVELLDGGRCWLLTREIDLYVDGHALTSAPVADWATVVDVGSRGYLADTAHELGDSVTTAVDDKGNPLPRGGPVAAPVEASPDSVTARMFLAAADRSGIPTLVHDPELDPENALAVLGIVAARALDRGTRLRFVLSWTAPGRCEYFDGSQWWPLVSLTEEADLPTGTVDSPVDLMVRDVAAGRSPAARLLEALIAVGADVDSPLGLTAAERSVRPAEFLGAVAGVRVHRGAEQLGEAWVAVIGTSGVWLVPEGPQVPWPLASGRTGARKELLARTGESFQHAGRADLDLWPGSLWMPEVELAEIRARGPLTIHAELVHQDGLVMSLRLRTAPSEGRMAILALRDMVGNRLVMS